MGGKGSNNCCCGGCAQVPRDSALGQGELQPMQQYCCSCLPKQICVQYQCGVDEVATRLFTVQQPCSPPYDTTTKYESQLPIDGDMRDIRFDFVVENEVCYMVLTADYFGATGDTVYDSVEINSYHRSILCPRCKPCDVDPPWLEWSVSSPGCANGIIRVRPANNTSIPPIPWCCDCPDPCYPDVTVEENCPPHCGGCGCICDDICLTVVDAGDVTTEVLTICNYEWVGSTVTIRLFENYSTGCCELQMDPTAGFDSTTQNVAIGENTLKPCPSPAAQWSFTDSTSGNFVQVFFVCSSCEGCNQIVVSSCCADSVPRILTASIDGGAGCCGAFTLSLIYDDTESAWIGYHPTAMCSHPLKLRLSCGASQWMLSLIGADSGPCTDDSDTTTGSCEPVNLSFSLAANGIGCCYPDLSGTLAITVTE